MIPIRDNIPSRTFPFVTTGLIAANIAVYFIQLFQEAGMRDFLFQYGFVPARFFNNLFTFTWNPVEFVLPVFTSMFLHGGWFHLISNCWYLWIFGDNIEDVLGHFKFLQFYIVCGIIALGAQALTDPYSSIPNIGASGAIAGVMGAYCCMFPRAKIVILFWFFIFFRFFEISAFFFLAFWFISQYLNSSIQGPGGAGVAWWAHLGGFLAGMLMIWKFGRKSN